MKPAELAQLCADIYDTTDGFTIYDCDGVYLGHSHIGSQDVFTFRGSANLKDWMDDFYSAPVRDPYLGVVHGGMFRGIPEAFLWAQKMLNERPEPPTDVVLTGHSLGGAHARLVAGLFAANHSPVTQIVTFGSPKPGCTQLKTLVEQSLQHVSYRHAEDIVPTLPPDIFGYVHTELWVEVGADPASGVFEPAEDHSINLYIAALRSM